VPFRAKVQAVEIEVIVVGAARSLVAAAAVHIGIDVVSLDGEADLVHVQLRADRRRA